MCPNNRAGTDAADFGHNGWGRLCPNNRAGTDAADFGHKAGVGVDTDGMNGPVVLPRSIEETLEALQEAPEATILAGGTDLMVDGQRRPPPAGRRSSSLRRVDELRGWRREGDDAGRWAPA